MQRSASGGTHRGVRQAAPLPLLTTQQQHGSHGHGVAHAQRVHRARDVLAMWRTSARAAPARTPPPPTCIVSKMAIPDATSPPVVLMYMLMGLVGSFAWAVTGVAVSARWRRKRPCAHLQEQQLRRHNGAHVHRHLHMRSNAYAASWVRMHVACRQLHRAAPGHAQTQYAPPACASTGQSSAPIPSCRARRACAIRANAKKNSRGASSPAPAVHNHGNHGGHARRLHARTHAARPL